MLCTKECEVCVDVTPDTQTWIQEVHTQVCTAPPDVMCVTLYVDRDQRWVLKHFRPLLSPQP